MIKEIGSEFWNLEINQNNQAVFGKNYNFLLTGRTAIDYIIKDIKQSREFEVVYLPSYCCHTMIQPFLDNDVYVEFYNVSFENGKYSYEIDFDYQCDAILIMQYFGFGNKSVQSIIERFKSLGKVVIEDATHSFLSESPYNSNSNYVFSSFRKWTGLACGAVAIKQEGEFLIEVYKNTNYEYIQLREQAALLKKEFIEEEVGDKDTFLSMFNTAENLLELDYQNYSIPREIKENIMKIDFNTIQSKRKTNAKYLIDELKNYTNIETVYLSSKDTPLFVPIIMKNGERDKLRKFLIDNKIYCPVHWPISKHHQFGNKSLYENSLSLVCDQRYSISDMRRIIQNISRFYGG